MALYSKEFVEKHFEEWTWDFSVEEIGMQLQPDQNIHVICEGYGFISIYMTKEGVRSVVFDVETFDDGSKNVEIVSIADLDRRYLEGSLPWQKKD